MLRAVDGMAAIAVVTEAIDQALTAAAPHPSAAVTALKKKRTARAAKPRVKPRGRVVGKKSSKPAPARRKTAAAAQKRRRSLKSGDSRRR